VPQPNTLPRALILNMADFKLNKSFTTKYKLLPIHVRFDIFMAPKVDKIRVSDFLGFQFLGTLCTSIINITDFWDATLYNVIDTNVLDESAASIFRFLT
jgi:hypothetical protein